LNPISEEICHPYLLDTSALFSYIEDEPGADTVEIALMEKTTIIPWTVLMEVYYITLQEDGIAEADRRIALMKELNLRILWNMNESNLLTAARLKAEHKTSFADAIIAAFAIRNNCILMHRDPEYETLRGLVLMEVLPYKNANNE